MKKHDVPGNSIASAAAFERAMVGIGERLSRMEHIADRLFDEDCMVKAVRVRFPTQERGDYMVVVTATREGEEVVGFHSDDSFAGAVSGLVSRLENGSMKWRADEYA